MTKDSDELIHKSDVAVSDTATINTRSRQSGAPISHGWHNPDVSSPHPTRRHRVDTPTWSESDGNGACEN